MSSVMKNIGIIGAGQMGCGIAHVSALAGYKVQMYDLSPDRIEAALATINGNLARQVGHGKLTDDERKAALSLISGSADLNDLAPMDLVIEAATEDESVKRKIYAQVCPILKQEALLATNTSSLSITRLASATDRPERFMGIHFMNPGARHRDRRANLPGRQGICRDARQDRDGRRGFPRFHRQPHPAADDQRGDLHAL
jgi:3-hydroxybutyryl-CoA dehydrogenase